jgi:hypothetical protein
MEILDIPCSAKPHSACSYDLTEIAGRNSRKIGFSSSSTVVGDNPFFGELNCVLQVPGLCITKLLDLFMPQDTRSAKLMCDERDLCQMLDSLHLLKSFQ